MVGPSDDGKHGDGDGDLAADQCVDRLVARRLEGATTKPLTRRLRSTGGLAAPMSERTRRPDYPTWKDMEAIDFTIQLESARAGESAALERVAEREATHELAIAQLEVALGGWSQTQEELAALHCKVRDLCADGPWLWLGDGTDDLESMAEGCVILIRACDLRAKIRSYPEDTKMTHDSYTAHGQLTPHTCPVCNGAQTVPAGFYTQNMEGVWSGSGAGNREICRSCSGTGVVWG